MTKNSTQIPNPRFWNPEQCAARLNRSVPWFYEHKARLHQLGMPKKDEALGGWDSKAFESWLDQRAGLNILSGLNMERQMLESIHGQN